MCGSLVRISRTAVRVRGTHVRGDSALDKDGKKWPYHELSVEKEPVVLLTKGQTAGRLPQLFPKVVSGHELSRSTHHPG